MTKTETVSLCQKVQQFLSLKNLNMLKNAVPRFWVKLSVMVKAVMLMTLLLPILLETVQKVL